MCDVAQHHCSTEVVGKFGEGLVEDQAIADVVDVVSGTVVGAFDRAAVTVVETRSPVALSEFVERGVRGDSVGPGAERRPAVEAWKVADDLDERFLACVVAVTAAPGDAATHGVDPVVMAPEQLIERVPVAALCGGDQCTVVEMCGDARSVTNRSVHDGDLTEASAVRIGVGAGGVGSEFLEHDEHVAHRGRRYR